MWRLEIGGHTWCRTREHLPADADCKCSFAPVAAFDQGHFAPQVGAWSVEYFVRVAMVCGAGVGVAYTVVGMAVVAHCTVLREGVCGRRKERNVNEQTGKLVVSNDW